MIFVSGATGYIGGAICRALAPVLGGVRTACALPNGVARLVTGDLAAAVPVLPPVKAVVHAAGLGHRRGVDAAAWRRANVDAAANLARASRAAGAERFVLISTAHVHGRANDGVVTDDTAFNPMDGYAASKLEAERAVAEIFGPGLTIVRPVAVIGPGCPGNLQLIMKLLARGIPLPFAAIDNRRSFIAADDLARLVLAVLQSPAPAGTILAAHPDSISTPNLIRALAQGMARPAHLFAIPSPWLAAGASAAGRAAMWQSLAGSFAAAPNAALATGWRPARTLAEALHETGRYYNTTGATG
jgi:nucleoside-diphosphate-sugar epimerase